MTTLSFSSVRKTFGATVALDDFSLELGDGEFITLLGPSGCGKTTALRIAAGFEVADGGSVEVAGADISRVPAHRRNMGMVFQSYSLFPNLTVAANIEFGLRTRGIATDARRARTGEMLELVQMSALADRYPHQLSGGQQQRVALARALAVQPAVLLLDEPLSALDAKVRTVLRDEIRRIQLEVGITTLFVTHDQEEALAVSDRVCVMSNGRVEQVGSPVDVYRQPANAFVARFVGTMNELPASADGAGGLLVAGIRTDTPVPVAASGALTALFRPEDVTFTESDQHGLAGSVVTVVFQGASSLVSVRVDGADRLVQVAASPQQGDQLRNGQRVGLSIDGSKVVVDHS
jgi:putative spermidine/putrescine transport system ATP-binding protein